MCYTYNLHLSTDDRACVCACVSRRLMAENGLFHHCTDIFVLENPPSLAANMLMGDFHFVRRL